MLVDVVGLACGAVAHREVVFLLEYLVTDVSVKFFMPFNAFRPPPVPKDVGTYTEYRRRSIEFIEARNNRIAQFKI